jgi:hypothetical protein
MVEGVVMGVEKSQCDCAAAYGNWLTADKYDVSRFSCVAVPIAAVVVNFGEYCLLAHVLRKRRVVSSNSAAS